MSIPISTDRDRIKKPFRPIDLPTLSGNQSIYKYISLDSQTSWTYLEQCLIDRKIFGSTNKKLNDPFESQPFIVDDISTDVCKKVLQFYDENGFKKDVSSLEKYKGKTAEFFREISKSAFSKTIENLRIISFCDTMASPLLWAHYAKSHKGAVLHFSAGAFSPDDTKSGLVQYSRQRPCFPLSLGLSLAIGQANGMCEVDQIRLRSDVYRSIAFTKPADWAYEGEFRVCYNANRNTNIVFEPGGLKEIICGSMMSEEDLKRVQALAARSSDNIALKKAILSSRTFSVEVASD